MYLPEDLNVKSLLGIFFNKYPGTEISYETFRQIYVSEFNIGFGYPRTDTCCWCDEQKAKLNEIVRKIAASINADENLALQAAKDKLITEKE